MTAHGAAMRERHQTYVDVIAEFVADRGYPPSVGELADVLGRSKSTVVHTLRQLADLGRIRRVDGSPRAIELVDREPVTEGERHDALAAALRGRGEHRAADDARAVCAALALAGWRLEPLRGAR